jgi:hypothetical protein
MSEMSEAPFSVTVKVNGDLLTVRGNSLSEFQTHLAELDDSDAVWELIHAAQSKAKPMSVAQVQQALNATVIPDPLATKPAPPAPVRPAAHNYGPAPASNAPMGAPPSCIHGPMRYVKGGVAKATGKGFPPFWSCIMPKGPEQCKSVNA